MPLTILLRHTREKEICKGSEEKIIFSRCFFVCVEFKHHMKKGMAKAKIKNTKIKIRIFEDECRG